MVSLLLLLAWISFWTHNLVACEMRCLNSHVIWCQLNHLWQTLQTLSVVMEGNVLQPWPFCTMFDIFDHHECICGSNNTSGFLHIHVYPITMKSWWAWWHLKSPASRLFTQPSIQGEAQRNIKAPRHWPLCREFTGGWWIPAQKVSNVENVSIWWRQHARYTFEARSIILWNYFII